MSRNITLAFAGSGKVKTETVAALLDDFLGFGPKDADGYPEPSENDIRLILPASVEHYNESLQEILNWSEYADLPYDVVLAKGDRDESLETMVDDAASTEEVANVNSKIIDLLSAADGEAYLILMWGDEGDEQAEILLDLADVAGVKAKDLTAALDDISFKEEDDAEPEPEPEPEPEKPTRGRRGARGATKKTEEALTPEEEPLVEQEPAQEPEQAPEPEPEKPARKSRGKKAVEPEPESADEEPELPVVYAPEGPAIVEVPWDGNTGTPSVDNAYFSGVLQSVLLHLLAQDQSNAYRNLDEPAESPLTALVREALEKATFGPEGKAPVASSGAPEPEEEPVKRGRGRPRNRPVEEETVGYLKNEDGVYRKAGRGRPKRGETKVDLTAADVIQLTAEGLVYDES